MELEFLVSQVNDPLMLFIDDCPAWEEQVGSNESALEEYSRLVEGPAGEEMLERVGGAVERVRAQVRARTGVEVGRSEVSLAWDMCRFIPHIKAITHDP